MAVERHPRGGASGVQARREAREPGGRGERGRSPDAWRFPRLETGEPAWARRYAGATEAMSRLLAEADWPVAATLGRYLAVIAPDALTDWTHAAVAAGRGHAAAILLDAQLAAGGPVTGLARPQGDGRLIDVAAGLVAVAWGRDAAWDALVAERLAGLFLRVDPTDSYLYAARWQAAAATGAAPRAATAGVGAGGEAVSSPAVHDLLEVWRGWFGWVVEGDGEASVCPPPGGCPAGRHVLRGVPLRGGKAVTVTVDAGIVHVQPGDGGAAHSGRLGERLALGCLG